MVKSMKKRTEKMSGKKQMKTNKNKQNQRNVRRKNSTSKNKRKIRNSRKHKQMKGAAGPAGTRKPGMAGKETSEPSTIRPNQLLSRSSSHNPKAIKRAMNNIIKRLVTNLLSEHNPGSLMKKMKEFHTSYLYGSSDSNAKQATAYKLSENIMQINIDKVQDPTSNHHKAVVLWTYIRFLCKYNEQIDLARAQTLDHHTSITKSQEALHLTFGLSSREHGQSLSQFLNSELKTFMDEIDTNINMFVSSLEEEPVNVSNVNTSQKANSEPHGATNTDVEALLRAKLEGKKGLFQAMIDQRKSEKAVQKDMFDPNLLALYYYNKCKVSVYKFFEETRGRVDDIKVQLENMLTVENIIGTEMTKQIAFVTDVLTNEETAIGLLTEYNEIIDDNEKSDEDKQDATLSYGIVYGAHVMKRTLENVVNSVSGVIQKFQEAEREIQNEIFNERTSFNQTYGIAGCPKDFMSVANEYPNLLSIVTIPSIRTLFLSECYDAYYKLRNGVLKKKIPYNIEQIFVSLAPTPNLSLHFAGPNNASRVFSNTEGHESKSLSRSATI